ncbi:MAG: NADP(H)-dependent aldo-keto reductase [Oceanococcaceae bacterium]
MKFRQLGPNGPQISLIGLGTMTWGEQNSPEEAFAQLDMAIGAGVNFIDAAEMYPVPPRPETQGRTEEILGQWLQQRGRHDDLVIATKVTGRNPSMDWIRGGPRLDRASIRTACEASLQRLGIDCIDLYQVHWPERSTNFFGKLGYREQDTPGEISIEETLSALGELVQEGKVRYIGLSNETPWGLAEYLRLADQLGLPRVASVQNPYNLLNRSYEIGLAEFAHRNDIGLLAYSPLAFGMLSGKYRDGAKPPKARLSLYERFSRYTNPQAIAATERYAALAEAHGLPPAQMALAYINQQPFVRSNLIGATSLEQLQQNLDSAALTLSAELLEAIEAIHREQPNPAP